MSMRCLILFISLAAAAPLHPSAPGTRGNILTNIIQDLKSLKSDVLSIISPSNMLSSNNLSQRKPSKNDFNKSPPAQFSQTSSFVVATTEAPKQESDEHQKQVELTGPSLYREDVVKKSWHYKKSRNLASDHNSYSLVSSIKLLLAKKKVKNTYVQKPLIE